ncbi:hypothetical protein PCNPT3_03995 [Psychromonas sp. CNPT3]|uniref:DUF2069 domain-containing protein n=1 Tax=Psychromonas sp. CNPT3 TaxID=314282 RepID=UPI00006E34BF|nr:DUF2069 domain-containing protein [Psychromonas sp. CNPT3]AGH80741.1 hypothetical protein PCNPT3_03995 [Psychromonas sp. CNPT3]
MSTQPIAKKTHFYQIIAQIGYFSLLLLVPLWHLYLSPPGFNINPWLITSIWLIPLLFPLRGILRKDPYTFAWCGFIALIYIMHSTIILYSEPSEVLLASIELFFSSLFLWGCIYFAKYRGIELGLSIRKKKKSKH